MTPHPHPTLTVRVHVYPQGGRWYAASTDFVLMAVGSTEDEAFERFIDASMGYFRTAVEEGWLDALNRRPALARRLEIRLRFWLARFTRQHPVDRQQQLRLA